MTGWRTLEPLGELPPARRDHVFVSDDTGDTVFLFGGRSEAGPLDDLWRYDVDANRWVAVNPPGDKPAPRFGHNAAFDADTGRLLLFGGQAGSSFFNDLWAFEVKSGAWIRLASGGAPQPRYGAGSGFDPLTRALYVTHGFTDQGRFDDTWTLSTDARWNDVSPGSGERPEKRCLLRSLADPERTRLILFGGQSNSAPFLGDLWKLDLGGSWRQLRPAGPSPAPRNLYSLVKAGRMPVALLFGGNTSAGKSDELWLLDLARDSWRQVGQELLNQGPGARDGHDAAWLEQRQSMLIFGGRAGSELNDLWELTADERWLGGAS
jgi:hypothetical protein